MYINCHRDIILRSTKTCILLIKYVECPYITHESHVKVSQTLQTILPIPYIGCYLLSTYFYSLYMINGTLILTSYPYVLIVMLTRNLSRYISILLSVY